MPADKQVSGFLSTYANLKQNPAFESTDSYVSQDPVKNIHKYVAVIVEPPVIYLATDTDEKTLPDRGGAALAEYFRDAITEAVGDAYPVVQSSGPLVLRLRSAIIGVDVGPAVSAGQKDEKTLDRPINIGKVGVEIEFVDSETGQQIAAAVDRKTLGEGTAMSSIDFSREEKFRAATQAFDGWAKRLREFLDSAQELSKEDIARNERTNFPYAPEPSVRKGGIVLGPRDPHSEVGLL
jgi:hypothetical protein